MPGVPLQLPAASVGVCVCMCARSDYLRSALHAQGAHLVHAQVTHVHALVGDLNGAALEVLLVEDGHLDRGDGVGGIVKYKVQVVLVLWLWFLLLCFGLCVSTLPWTSCRCQTSCSEWPSRQSGKQTWISLRT